MEADAQRLPGVSTDSRLAKPRRPGVVEALLFVGIALLYLVPAFRVVPDVGLAREDLDVVRRWQHDGRLSSDPARTFHVVKPGYLLYLKSLLPHAGSDAAENRRLLVIHAAALLSGLAAMGLALRRFGRGISLVFLFFAAIFLPLRDCADYIAPEPLAASGVLLAGAGLLRESRGGLRNPLVLGCLVAVVTVLRPNVGALLLVLAAVLTARSVRASALLLLGLASTLAAVWIAVRAAGMPGNPLAVGSSRVLIWGTADYYWRPDLGVFPSGRTPAETNRLSREETAARWTTFFRTWNRDRERSFLWRLGHGILSAEALPSRWVPAPYLEADKLVRRWWWLLAAFFVGASTGAAAGSRSPWRLLPLLLAAATVAQALLFGADPRYALPQIPLLVALLAILVPTIRWSLGVTGAAAAGFLLVVSLVLAVPDAAASDYAVVRGPGRVLALTLSPGRLPSAPAMTLHFRLLQKEPFPLGLSVFGNGTLLFERRPDDSSAWPAAFSIPIDDGTAADSRVRGLRLEIRTTGDPSSGGFLFYPVVPSELGGSSTCTVDGERRVASGYGGEVEGGIPLWVHAGGDGEAAASPR